MSHIDIVFTAPPGPGNECVFVEAEDAAGKSIRIGEWVTRQDGSTALRIPDLRAELAAEKAKSAAAEEMTSQYREMRWFPLQTEHQRRDEPPLKPQRTRIPWDIAEKAYGTYSARLGKQQSLERLAERGGFSNGEMDMFHPTWRKEADETEAAGMVCSTCSDTHTMPATGFMCTHCPLPCMQCRCQVCNAYCASTPCTCACHLGTR